MHAGACIPSSAPVLPMSPLHCSCRTMTGPCGPSASALCSAGTATATATAITPAPCRDLDGEAAPPRGRLPAAAKTNIAPVRATHPPGIERRVVSNGGQRRPTTLKVAFVDGDGAGKTTGQHDVSAAEGAVVGQRPSWTCYRSAPGGMAKMQSLPRG